MWYWVYWAIWGFIGSQIILFLLWTFIVNRYCNKLPQSSINEKEIFQSFLSQKKQIFQYVYTSILIALLMNIDILIVKNIFDWEQAWYYAGVSVIAKFLIFLWFSIETVYYPQLVKEKTLPIKWILKASIYYIALTWGALLFFFVFGESILRIFKEGLQEYIWLTYSLLIYSAFVAYISIIVKTMIAFEKYIINYLLTIVVSILLILIYTIWDTLSSVAYIFMLSGGLWLVLSIVVMFVSNKNHE